MIDARMRAVGLDPPVTGEMLSIEAIHALVALGFGASVLPDVGAGTPGAPRLGVLDIGGPPLRRTLDLLSRLEVGRRRTVQVVADAFARAGSTELDRCPAGIE